MSHETLLDDLRTAYDRRAGVRSASPVEPWKAAERERFLARLREAEARTLLEVGSGPGIHGRYFADNGLDVACTDLSPEHVRLCQERGLEAHVLDFHHLDFVGRTFDSVFALNCLLHVPRAELPGALAAICGVLAPDGLFYWGQYSGDDSEGVLQSDDYEPKRFYARLKDATIQREATDAGFEVLDFHRVKFEAGGWAFHSVTLRA